MPEFELPKEELQEEVPETTMPEFELPKEEVQEEVPETTMPKFELPKEEVQEEVPETTMPEFKLPKEEVQEEVPEITMPEFELPKEEVSDEVPEKDNKPEEDDMIDTYDNINKDLNSLISFETYDDYLVEFQKQNYPENPAEFYIAVKNGERLPELLTETEFYDERRKQLEDIEHDKQNESIISLTQKLHSCEGKLQVSEEQNAELERRNKNLSSNLNRERSEKLSAQNRVTELEDELKKSKARINSLENTLMRQKESVKEQGEKIFALRTTINNQLEEIKSVKAMLSNKDLEIKTLKEENEQLKGDKKDLKAQIRGFETQVTGAINSIKQDGSNKNIVETDKKKLKNQKSERDLPVKKTSLSKKSPSAVILPGDVIDAFEEVTNKKGKTR